MTTVQELWDQGLLVQEIAERMGQSHERVRRALNELNISVAQRRRRASDRQKKVDPLRDEQIYESWRQGSSYTELCRLYETNDQHIIDVLDSKGVLKEERRARQGGKHKRGPKVPMCCACGIILEFSELPELIAMVQCENCSYLECTKKSWKKPPVEGKMCPICQRHLNVEPRCAGNIGVPKEVITDKPIIAQT